MNQFPPIRTVSNFSKIRGDIRKSRCTTGINDTGGKITGGKIAAGFKDIGGKFATGINDNGGKFSDSLVLLIPVANLPPLSTTPAVPLRNSCFQLESLT
jgi:hypothetical protein